MIYLDNAATTLQKPAQVGEAMAAAVNTMGNSSRGTHEGALDAARRIYGVREALARLLGCRSPEGVVFTSNATEGLNMVLEGIFRPGDHVITTELEHNSVLRPLYRLESERGVRLSFVEADEKGCLNYTRFHQFIEKDTRAIVCTHASNLTGNMVDIVPIAQIAREHNLLLIVDGAQTCGALPVDMEEMGIDILCFTGHKGLMGPQGTGGVCINTDVEIRPLKVGGSGFRSYDREHPSRLPESLEAGTLNGHGLAGLGAAADFIIARGIEQIGAHDRALTEAFCERVRRIEGVRVYGDFSSCYRAPIVALNVGNLDSGVISDELSRGYGIAARGGAHCAPLMHKALGTQDQGAVRFSFSCFNTMEEIYKAAAAVKEIAGEWL